ncbi:MAG: prolipoprotein diacylglyceryl transferase [Algisphaera sp.]
MVSSLLQDLVLMPTPTLAAWLHTIDPYALMLWEGGPIRWYGLSYLLGFFGGFLLIRRVCRVGVSTLAPQRAGDLVIATALGAMIGGRLGYVVFYRPELLTTWDTSRFPYWGVLDMLKGGMASHGGMIGALLGAGWFAWRQRQSWLHLADLLAFGSPVGLACGRLANFVNGELLGDPCRADFPLAVQFPQELAHNPALLGQMVKVAGDSIQPETAAAALSYDPGLWTAAAEQIITRIQSGSVTLQAAAAQVLPTRHPSPLYAAALEGVLVLAVLIVVWIKPRRAGTLVGAFGLAYAAARIGGEFFRVPDAATWHGISRGQLLSLPLVLAGLGLILYARMKRTPIMGGWRSTPPHKPAKAHAIADSH